MRDALPVHRLIAFAGLLALAACSSAPPGEQTAGVSTERHGFRTKLDGWGPQTPPKGFPRFIDHSVGQEEISMQAMGLVGVPYRWGGNSPTAGFDCSGLVRYVVARAANVLLPRTTADMSHEGVSISPSDIAPGDLIFFDTDGRAHSHVGIYVGDYRFVNAPSTGGTVRIDYVTNPYWARHFDGIRRVAGLDKSPILDTPIAPGVSPDAPRTVAPDMVASTPPMSPVSNQATPTPTMAAAAQPAPALGTAATSTAPAAPSSPSTYDPIAAAIARADQMAPRNPHSAAVAQQSQQNNNDDDPIARLATRGY